MKNVVTYSLMMFLFVLAVSAAPSLSYQGLPEDGDSEMMVAQENDGASDYGDDDEGAEMPSSRQYESDDSGDEAESDYDEADSSDDEVDGDYETDGSDDENYDDEASDGDLMV